MPVVPSPTGSSSAAACLTGMAYPSIYSEGSSGNYYRVYLYPQLGSITGYTHPVYGQAGLEASLDPYFRGLQGNPASSIWWDHLVYGQPPPGLDVRLSLDLALQEHADSLLGKHTGAVVLLNAGSGEILAMASHPTYDPNLLDSQAAALLADPHSPLLDRAAQSLYPLGDILGPFLRAAGLTSQSPSEKLRQLYSGLGFYTTPDLRLPVAIASKPGDPLSLSPLQLALAASALSNAGIRPAPRLALSVKTPSQGWVVLPASSDPVTAMPSAGVRDEVQKLMVTGQPYWQWSGSALLGEKTISWSLAGTLPAWQGTPLAIVVLLEDNDKAWAAYIGQNLLETATMP